MNDNDSQTFQATILTFPLSGLSKNISSGRDLSVGIAPGAVVAVVGIAPPGALFAFTNGGAGTGAAFVLDPAVEALVDLVRLAFGVSTGDSDAPSSSSTAAAFRLPAFRLDMVRYASLRALRCRRDLGAVCWVKL